MGIKFKKSLTLIFVSLFLTSCFALNYEEPKKELKKKGRVANSDYEGIKEQLSGIWFEKNSDCEARLVFGPADKLAITYPNSEAIGNYLVKKAVTVPDRTYCKIHDCFEVEYQLETVKKTAGCSKDDYSLDDYPNEWLFHFKDKNTIVYWLDIEFSRMR